MSEHAPDLIDTLTRIAGEPAVRTDEDSLALAGSDVYGRGETPAAMIRPETADALAACIRAATERGYAIAPRGGGLSYTSGYIPVSEKTVSIDLSGLNRIIDIAEEDMTITVEAGVTWKKIYETLKPMGLRLPFFGTFSGMGATVGGGLSQGALFFGSARYGSAAETVLGLDVACADGSILRTGQGALKAGSKPFSRTYGPDLTGLFVHDCGVLGVKTQATLKMIQTPAVEEYASFAFERFSDASLALSKITREDLAEEVYVLDPYSTDNMAMDTKTMMESAAGAARAAGGAIKAAKTLAGMAAAGKDFVPKGHFSLHLTAAGRNEAAVAADLERAAKIAAEFGGKPIADTIPRVSRATIFSTLNGILGDGGMRWAALNAKVAHSDALELVAQFDAMMAPYQAEMERLGVVQTRLASALTINSYSFEPVFRWHDEWLPMHKTVAEPDHLRKFNEPPAAPESKALVDSLRRETVMLFKRFGASSNQIGRAYPYFSALADEPAALLMSIKRHLDPDGLMNPGVLEMPSPAIGEVAGSA